MGTNFYIEESSYIVETRQLVKEQEHIGKRSGGWTFLFQGKESKTVNEWKARLNGLAANQKIVDEYGHFYTPDQFWEMVESTTMPWGPKGLTPKVNSNGDGNWQNNGFAFSNYEFC